VIPAALAFVLLVAGGAAMLAVPFIPLWHEWRRPTDDRALTVDRGDANDIDYFASRFRAQTRERVRQGAWSSEPARWPHAEEPIVARGPLHLERPMRCTQPVRVTGDFTAPSGSSFSALLVDGDLLLGGDAEITAWGRATGSVSIGAGTIAVRRISAGREIEIVRECTFERMCAPRIVFGDSPGSAGAPPSSSSVETRDLASLPGASVAVPGVVRIDRDASLAGGVVYEGTLIVAGSLTIGDGAVLTGSAKAHEGIVVGEHARVGGALVSPRAIHLLSHCRVGGPVVSEADIVIGEGVVIGSPEKPTSVTAENILVAEGAVAHGTVWANDVGVVWRA
jgi:cytoskeletal protein CcmA (bactofilin family)